MNFPDVQEEAFVLELATEIENIAAEFAAFMAECAAIFESGWAEVNSPAVRGGGGGRSSSGARTGSSSGSGEEGSWFVGWFASNDEDKDVDNGIVKNTEKKVRSDNTNFVEIEKKPEFELVRYNGKTTNIDGFDYYQIYSSMWMMDSWGIGKPLIHKFYGGQSVIVHVQNLSLRFTDAILKFNNFTKTTDDWFGIEITSCAKRNVAIFPLLQNSYKFSIFGDIPIPWDIRLGKGDWGVTCLWVTIYSSSRYYYRRKGE